MPSNVNIARVASDMAKSNGKDIDPALYDCNVLFPDLSNPSAPATRRWLRASAFTTAAVGLASKFFMRVLTHCELHHGERLFELLDHRPKSQPLITVSNHHSCMDDPLLWGLLRFRHLTNHSVMRWILSAHDVCFTKRTHSLFFSYGKSIPVVRGNGVYQPGVNFCLDRLNEGSWSHIYPEGQVNEKKTDLRLKWGVGRLVVDASVTPVVLPIYHLGMDEVLPNRRPYIPHFCQRVTVCVGEPIPVEEALIELRSRDASPEETRKAITDLIDIHLKRLKVEATILHAKHTYVYN